MDFDKILDKKGMHQKGQKMHGYRRGISFGHKQYYGDYGIFNPIEFINSIKRSKKIKKFFPNAVLTVIAVVGFIAILFPTIKVIINYIS